MSTRANILVKDSYGSLWFYKHSDGYPEGVMPLLNKFMDWIKAGKIRNNVSQGAGWLIILGAIEYNTMPGYGTTGSGMRNYGDLESVTEPRDWKCGSIEPTTGEHGDIDYRYTLDLETKTILIEEVHQDYGDIEEGKTTYEVVEYDPQP